MMGSNGLLDLSGDSVEIIRNSVCRTAMTGQIDSKDGIVQCSAAQHRTPAVEIGSEAMDKDQRRPARTIALAQPDRMQRRIAVLNDRRSCRR